jgi:hypothetical protein
MVLLAVALLAGLGLCLHYDEGPDPCHTLLALVAIGTVVLFLEPVGGLTPRVAPSYRLIPLDLLSPPPRG